MNVKQIHHLLCQKLDVAKCNSANVNAWCTRVQAECVDELEVRECIDFVTIDDIKDPHHCTLRKGFNFFMRAYSKYQKTPSCTLPDALQVYHKYNSELAQTVCKRCKSTDLIRYMRQTRSADEPTSEFLECRNCRLVKRVQ